MIKRKSSLLFSLLLFCSFFNIAAAQDYVKVRISEGKTTHLIFPSGVRYYDYGSDDVGVQETTEPNIIKVKAAVTNFPNTNLTVMTDNNIFYSFILEYENNPKQLNYFIESSQGREYQPGNTDVKLNNEGQPKNAGGHTVDSSEIDVKTDLILFDLLKNIKNDGFISGTRKSRITLVLKEILVDNDNLYFVIDAKNESAINYDIDFIKFFIKPRSKRKRTTIQDVEITPVNSFNVPTTLVKSADGLSYFAFVLNKFTVAEDKKFVVEMWEKNGERSIELEISNRILLNAKNINSIHMD